MAMAAALSTLVPQRADRLLLAAVGLCAVAAVFGAYGLPGLWLHWLGKPLATVGLLLFAARGRSAAPRYRGGVLAGLALSLLGDVLLMWPRDLFAAGLGAFLLAHFAYITAWAEPESGVVQLRPDIYGRDGAAARGVADSEDAPPAAAANALAP